VSENTEDQSPGPNDDPLWYQDAIIYEVHVRAFFDSNNDGIGDFSGLTAKLDYIQDLGVNTIWVLPFYPSPMRDDGYDIADYHDIHPDYGTRKDFQQFVREAHRRGLRVITELVINHTSDQHPWFQAARKAPPGSPKREFYVWSDDDEKFPETRIIFTDTEKSNWAWDDTAGAYYWHRFFTHQPDLNHNNPEVVKAVTKVMRFWLDLGVDGLRLDAIPYLCVREGTNNENLPETHAVIRQMRAVVDEHYKNRMFLAEANQWPEDVRDYFGNGDECHVAYHFPLMPRMYMAIAQEDRHPIAEILAQTPDIPENCQWAIFLRNHDELTLEMVTSQERDYMYQMYAADPRARLNLGIRRRLAPLMENDPDRIKLMNSLLLSMPGAPIIYYGDELGMGDNIFLGDRNGVRTPMQWSPDRNAGFSRADPQRLYLPPIMDPVYGYEAVNVEAQRRDPSSLLNWMRRLLAVRKSSRAFGRGKMTFLRPGNRKILAFLREYGDEAILCVANLARSAQPVELDLSRFKSCVPVELMGRTAFPPIGELPYLLTLHGHGFFWFRLEKGGDVPEWHEERLPREELPLLVLFDGWNSFFRDRVVPWRMGMADRVREQLESDALPRFLAAQRWYAAKGDPIPRARLADHLEQREPTGDWLVAMLELEGTTPATYFTPLSLRWQNGNDEPVRALLPVGVARVRQQAQIGVLGDAFADEAFCRQWIESMRDAREINMARGRLRFLNTHEIQRLTRDLDVLTVRMPSTLGSNTAIRLGESLFLKAYRRLQFGINPEFEIGRHLTDVSPFPNIVPVAGAVEYHDPARGVATLAILQGYVENQGDGWSFTLNYLERYLEGRRSGTMPANMPVEAHGAYLALVHTLGQRTAELHAALAQAGDDPAFEPEPVTHHDLENWRQTVVQDVAVTFDLLSSHTMVAGNTELADMPALRESLLQSLQHLSSLQFEGLKSRYHGDYHLGQVLLVRNDFVIIDFEGEPARTLEERRRKHSPLRDVAGMLRSFSYAAATILARQSGSPVEMPNWPGDEIRNWETETRQTFLAAYTDVARERGLLKPLTEIESLIMLFSIEKALYEVRYELAHRPEWIHIPLRGLRNLVHQP